jgi:hypothetical protein
LEKRKAIEKWKQGWMNAARADVWTQEQQTAFENALLEAPVGSAFAGSAMEAERAARWNFIAAAVEGKTVNQCLMRYKLLVQVVADRKKEMTMSSPAI